MEWPQFEEWKGEFVRFCRVWHQGELYEICYWISGWQDWEKVSVLLAAGHYPLDFPEEISKKDRLEARKYRPY